MVIRFPHKVSIPSNTARIAEATRETARVDIEKRDENVHVASTRESVAAGGTLNIHIQNPSGSGVDCNLAQVEVNTRFQGNYTIYDAFSSEPSGGSELEVDNLLMDSDDVNGEGVVVVNTGVSFTDSGTPHLLGVIPSGGQGANQIGGQSLGTRPLIEPGREIVIEVLNDSSESDVAAVTVVYTEEDL